MFQSSDSRHEKSGLHFFLSSKLYCNSYSFANNWSYGKRSELIKVLNNQTYIEASFITASWLRFQYGDSTEQRCVKLIIGTLSPVVSCPVTSTTTISTINIPEKQTIQNPLILMTTSTNETNNKEWLTILSIVIGVLAFILLSVALFLSFLLGYMRRMKKIIPLDKNNKPVKIECKQNEDLKSSNENDDLRKKRKFYIKRSRENGSQCVHAQIELKTESSCGENLITINENLNFLNLNAAEKAAHYREKAMAEISTSQETLNVVKSVLSKHVNPVPCEICGELMKNIKGVKLHMAKRHKN
ncbi:unnamed protein product [Brachionus calyciflorus]|uniref:C2H2-type domain-containing protein n=1 Tax=Brachionus calyciflorus TaxID=104777 RepID=A0A813X7F8_9BILA|nr:unnamed protein product [Brachionus calyciflorus]